MNAIRYNTYTGLILRWKRLFIPVIIFLYLSIPVGNSFNHLEQDGSLISLLLYIFAGKNPSFGEMLELPLGWMIVQIGCLLYNLDYPLKDLTRYGCQIFTRCKKRATWWNAKYIWCIMSTTAYWGIGVLVLIVYCLLKGFSINLSLSQHILERFFDSAFLPTMVDCSVFDVIFHVLFMPLLTMITLNVLQMYLSISLDSGAGGFFLTCALLIWSAFQCTPFAIGNYGMLQRNALFSTYGISYTAGFWGLLCINLLILVFGRLSIKKRNLLNTNNPGGSE